MSHWLCKFNNISVASILSGCSFYRILFLSSCCCCCSALLLIYSALSVNSFFHGLLVFESIRCCCVNARTTFLRSLRLLPLSLERPIINTISASLLLTAAAAAQCRSVLLVLF